MSAENKAIETQIFNGVWNDRNLDLIDEFFEPGYVGHSLAGDDPVEGPEGMKAFVSRMLEAFPDISMTIEDEIAEGDKVVIRWTARGTHDGDLMGIEPTGRSVTFAGMGIFRFRDGKIAEGWMNPNLLGLFRQLGMAPQPARA